MNANTFEIFIYNDKSKKYIQLFKLTESPDFPYITYMQNNNLDFQIQS